MRNVPGKVLEVIKAHVLSSITFFQKWCHYGVMWKNMVQPDTLQMKIKYSA